MKIATFNINNINRRLANLVGWLKRARPDVVCLQELKAADAAFPEAALERAGYRSVWHGQKTWNGVAILARKKVPVLIRKGLPGGLGDSQSRYIEAAVNGLVIGCLYLPNGNPRPGPKFTYKLDWFCRLHSHGKSLLDSGAPVVLAGDYNAVPTDFDIYSLRSWRDDALVQPETRAAYAKLLAQGWVDCLRTLFPDKPMYTFWDYKRHRWERNAGLRLDHLLISPNLGPRLVRGGVDRVERGRQGASDHAPAWIELRQSGAPGPCGR
jgi:exodeoxyribonuclease III